MAVPQQGLGKLGDTQCLLKIHRCPLNMSLDKIETWLIVSWAVIHRYEGLVSKQAFSDPRKDCVNVINIKAKMNLSLL